MDLADVLSREDARACLARQVYSPEPLERFAPRAQAAGLDAPAAWEAAAGIASLLAEPVPHARLLGLEEGAWVAQTPDVLRRCTDIVCRTAATAPLAQSMRRRLSRGNFIRPYIDEVSAGFALDGIRLDFDSLLPLVKGNRAPATRADRLFLNLYGLEVELMAGERAAESGESLVALHAALAKGADVPAGAQAVTDEEALAAVAELVDGAARAPLPLLNLVAASAIMWERKPFSQLNGAMEVLVRTLVALAAGLPALSCVPYAAHDAAAGAAGAAAADNAGAGPAPALALTTPFGQNATPYLLARLESLARGLDELEAALAALDARDDSLLSLLEADFRLNHRQREAMACAVSDLEFSIDVTQYCDRYGVTPATARADLRKLVELDYLMRDHDASRIRYRARPDLQTKIEAFARKSRGPAR